MTIATFPQMKAFLKLKESDISDYSTLEILLNSMQSTFESYTNRFFDVEERTYTKRVSFEEGETRFWLKGVPIKSISSVTIDSDSVITDFVFDDSSITLPTAAVFGSLVTIVYQGGLVDNSSPEALVATLPGDLNLAAVRQIAFEYQNRARVAVTTIGLDGNTTRIPSLELLKYTKTILDSYYNYGAGS